VIEESPDRQPIPALNGVSGSRAACGDLSLDPGGIASVVAVGVKCPKALRVAERCSEGNNAEGFNCPRRATRWTRVPSRASSGASAEAEEPPSDDALPRPEED
jgi:hypothetical protein